MYATKSTITSNQENTARLYSPLTNNTSGDKCLHFYYNMFGSENNTLNVYLSLLAQLSPETLIWSNSADNGNKWFRAMSNLKIPNRNTFQVINYN